MSSEVKVNKISPASGTSIVMGDSGDTLTIPSGVTLTNNGTASGFGKVLQVVQTVKTDGFSTSSTSHTDITGLSASITPSSTSSKILIIASIGHIGFSAAMAYGFQLVRNSTNLGQGTVAGKTPSTFGGTGNTSRGRSASYTFLDSPSTTSSIDYKVQVRVETGTCYINYRNSNNLLTTSSSITLMEIAG